MNGLDSPGLTFSGQDHELGTLRVDFAVAHTALGYAGRVSPRDVTDQADFDLATLSGQGPRGAHVSGKVPGPVVFFVLDRPTLEDNHVVG